MPLEEQTEPHEAEDRETATVTARQTQHQRHRMRGSQVGSHSHKEAEGVAEGEEGGEEATLWYHRRFCKLCPANLQVLRLHQQEEGTEVEEGQGGVEYKGFLSAPLQAVASLEGS